MSYEFLREDVGLGPVDVTEGYGARQEVVIDSSEDLDDSPESRNLSTYDVGGTSWWISSLIVVNAALGAGLLNFPKAFDDAGGIAAATIVHVILLAFAVGSLMILGWCSDIAGSESYQDTVGVMCGVWFRRVASGIIAFYCYGTCITFLVIVGDQSDRVFYDKLGDKKFCEQNFWYTDRRFVVSLLSLLLIFPLCFAKKIDFLKYVSGAATLGVFYLVFVTVYVFYETDTSDVAVKTKPTKWTDVFLVIPAICFGYQCHVSVIPVYSCIKPHSLWNFAKTISVALTVCFLSYTLVGVYGYLTYGKGIKQDLLSSYSTNKPVVLVAYVIFAIKTFLTYPILLFCGRIAFDSLVMEWRRNNSDEDEKKRRVLTGTVWFLSSLLIGIFVPNITVVIDYLGSMASIFIFILPGFCLFHGMFRFECCLQVWKYRLGLILASVYIVFGCFLFGLTLAQGVQYDMSLGKTNSHNLCH